MELTEREYELAYFEMVLKKFAVLKGQVDERKIKVDESVSYGMKHFNSDNVEQFTELTMNSQIQSQLEQRQKNITRALKKPYFTRVDFNSDTEEQTEKIYIGKASLFEEEDLTPLVVDWRAPAANLYYEGRLGRAEYDSPEGKIEGEILLKRQYNIEDGQLLDFFDIDITASDDFLQAALGASKDRRLKDIVSTIQAEQNRVIRAGMNRPLVVQGAAGSGKTTIALHRIAYLLYNFDKRLAPKNVMIIAPNRFFISYISDVLPDLGVENVYQTTLEDFVSEFVEEKIVVKPAMDKLGFMIKNPDKFNSLARLSTLKSSLRFMRALDNFIEDKIKELIPERDFALGKYILYPRFELVRLIVEEYKFLPISKRVPEIRKYLVNELKRSQPRILESIENHYDYLISSVKKSVENSPARQNNVAALLNERDGMINTLKKQSKTLVSDYLKFVKIKKSTEYYREFVEDFCKYAKGIFDENECKALQNITKRRLNDGFYEEEDLAPLAHLQYRFFGKDYWDLRHIVIDEAQDVSVFQIAVLREIMGTDSFSILGDLRQGIFSYKGINDWRSVTETIFGGKAEYVTLRQSYRTTVEIMDFANKIADFMRLEVPKAVPVIRHGQEVLTETVQNTEELAAKIDKKIKEYRESGLSSIAVIGASIEECEALRDKMRSDAALLKGRENGYEGGTAILPAYLAKGLEFDGVIIADASAANFDMKRDLDVKLLYVAMTRALHQLSVFKLERI